MKQLDVAFSVSKSASRSLSAATSSMQALSLEF